MPRRPLATPHDHLFRSVFSQPEHAAGEIRAVLPAGLAARIDWSTLQPLPADFVDDELRGSQADLLFEVRIGRRPALVYILLEHQSTSPALMPYRLLCYMTRIWQAHLAKHAKARRLPPILPIVVHHGERGWRRSSRFADILDVDADLAALLAPCVPDFEFLLDDLGQLHDDELRARSMTTLGRLALFCLARARSADFRGELERWMAAVREVFAAPSGRRTHRDTAPHPRAPVRRAPRASHRPRPRRHDRAAGRVDGPRARGGDARRRAARALSATRPYFGLCQPSRSATRRSHSFGPQVPGSYS